MTVVVARTTTAIVTVIVAITVRGVLLVDSVEVLLGSAQNLVEGGLPAVRSTPTYTKTVVPS